MVHSVQAYQRKLGNTNIMVDLVKKRHNVINKPIISWSESPMEKIAMAPLHILLGLVNRLYTEARPSDSASSRRDRQLYKHHCLALCRYKVYRSEYWNATLVLDELNHSVHTFQSD